MKWEIIHRHQTQQELTPNLNRQLLLSLDYLSILSDYLWPNDAALMRPICLGRIYLFEVSFLFYAWGLEKLCPKQRAKFRIWVSCVQQNIF